MDQDKRLHKKPPLAVRLSMRSECPYIAGRTEQRVAVDISQNPTLHDQMARAGFRRVENWVYKPACPGCNACVPWRVDTANFKMGRNLSRIWRINDDLTRHIAPISPTAEHYSLFKCYIDTRHGDGQMASMGHDEFVSMIENSPIESVLLNYVDDDGKLIGTVLTDVQNDGLSAVYSFFDPAETKRSLGTYMIMDMIDFAKQLGLPWLYLGYYVEDSSKMYYKARFQPASVFIEGQWRKYEAPNKP